MLELLSHILATGIANSHLPLLASSGVAPLAPKLKPKLTDDGLHFASCSGRTAVALKLAGFGDQPVVETIYSAYDRMLRHLAATEYRHLWRLWHVLPHLQCYQQFNQGRAKAYRLHGIKEPTFPAATVVAGGDSASWMLCAIAGATEAVPMENLRQCSAYRYPSIHGSQPPQFSRAVQVLWDDDKPRLLLSGTASIVGHKSIHLGSLRQQLQEAVRNVDTMVAATGLGKALQINAYLCHNEDAPQVLAALEGNFYDCRLNLYQANMCRQELLVELDGAWA
ncbi:MAG: hypothetical protein ACNYPG_01640 [Candidatus Porifericomitaceae bacterium WSBS_2022_MAG_OTU9]